ncbi:MAG TPA: hypothetical protein VEA99_10005 [Gemmatimonadaceae bacterium]|nr:hypothetical protein [Gemmatimonadaceae bacterium]
MRSAVRIVGIAVAAACLVAAPTRTAAQQLDTFVITPYAAVYVPTADVVSQKAAAGPFSAAVSGRHDTALALGANASYWITDRFALEVGGAYAFSNVESTGALAEPGGSLAFSQTDDAYVLLASAKVMVNMLPSSSRYNVRLGVGPAVIHRGGDGYKRDEAELTALTNVGGAVSLCTKFPVTPRFGVRLRAESYMYSTRIRLEDPTDNTSFRFDSKFQNDLLLSAGFQLTLR